jgi:hypothetical protein
VTVPQANSSHQVRFGQPSEPTGAAPGFGRGGAIAGIVLVVALLGGLLWSAAGGHAASAERPHLFGGSLVLEDDKPLPLVDVATGQLTGRLYGVFVQAGASTYSNVQAVPVDEGTILVDQNSGSFNLLGRDNYVLDTTGAVGLGPRVPGQTAAGALAAGSSAYIVRYTTTGHRSTVSLVDQATVEAGAKLASAVSGAGGRAPAPSPATRVTPRGFAPLSGPIANQPGSAAVEAGDMWALVQSASGCQVQQLHPVTRGNNGLTVSVRATIPSACTLASVESAGGVVAVAYPGHVRLFARGVPGGGHDVSLPATSGSDLFLPVDASTGGLWFLARGATGWSGWSDFGVSPTGRIAGRAALRNFAHSAAPAPPVESGGLLYTLDRHAGGQPTLWSIVPGGAMVPVSVLGQDHYPLLSSSESGRPFKSAQVLVDGPRVIFNNPGSLLAVVVFTDGSHPPVEIAKAEGAVLSPTGPEDLNMKPGSEKGGGAGSKSVNRQQSVVQPVSQSITCAKTTQKPYAPQITAVNPSATSALVAWSYQLLDEQDCEPDSWSVTMTAANGSHQPARPVQIVNGQTQLEFTGLRPATTYRAVVKAYINTQSTASAPATFTTAARGPDAPIHVQTSSDGKGDWIVSWTPCSPGSCVVPADAWNVIGTSCGTNFIGQPPEVQVAAGQTSVTINADGLGMLGDSLSFSVQGMLASGLTGSPTPDNSCTQAWRAPNPSALTLDASAVPTAGSITATMQVLVHGISPVEAFGSQTTDFVYHIGSVTLPPTTATRVEIPGLTPGLSYTPTVTVYPAGHPDASVTIAATGFTPNLAWPPDLGVVASGAPEASNPNVGDITLSFPGLPAGPMEVDGDPIQCGSQQAASPIKGQIQNGSLTIPGFDLVNLGGACSVSVNLTPIVAPGQPNPYGNPSPTLSAQFTIGSVPTYAFSDQFSTQCQQSFCNPEQIEVDYTPTSQMPAPIAGGDWIITTSSGSAGPSDPCAAQLADDQSPTFPFTVVLPTTCAPPSVDPSTVDVKVSYHYLGVTETIEAGTPSNSPGTTTTTAPTTTTTIPSCTTTTSTSSTSTSIDSSTSSTTDATTSTTDCSSASDAAVRLFNPPNPPTPSTPPTATPERTPGGSGAVPAKLLVAHSRLRASTLRGDDVVSDALGAMTIALLVASFGGRIALGRRRRSRRVGSNGDGVK